MRLYSCLSSIFESFNNKGIRYCIIRDFEDVESINTSIDIDVVICKDDKKVARQEFNALGWLTCKVNLSKYGHEHFFKWNGESICVIDVIWDVYYADGKYRFKNQEGIFLSCNKLEQINIPNEKLGLQLLLLHVLFDKNNISTKNYEQLKRLSSLCSLQDDIMYSIAKCIVEDKQSSISAFDNYRNRILSSDILSSNRPYGYYIVRNLRRVKVLVCSKCRLSCIFKFFHNPYKVAIIGTDGSGKSSTISLLSDYYENATVQYMGFRNDCWESAFAKRVFRSMHKNPPRNKILKFLKTNVAAIYDGYYRFNKAVNSGTRLVLFDRYYWERYDNQTKWHGKIFAFLFYKLFFPQPDLVVYLYCPTEVSLQRKDDIDDVDDFIEVKKRFDNLYIGRNDVLSINTSEYDIKEVCGMIIEKIASLGFYVNRRKR